jgi:hypothetical protein
MDRKVDIKKTVFNRDGYKSTIDRNFKFYKVPEPLIDPDTVEELFRLYDKLYMLIPIEGENTSHQYLVERSSELYQIDAQLENIQPLLDEVASLRGQILEGNRRILELETQLANGGELNFEDAEQMALLRGQLDAANSAITVLEQANTIANSAVEQASAAANAAATAAAEAAEKAAAEKAAQDAASAASADTGEVDEIYNILGNKNDSVGLAYRFIVKNQYTIFRFHRGSTYFRNYAKSYSRKWYWLFGKDNTDTGYYSKRRRNYNSNANREYLIPTNRDTANDMTLDFIVSELTQAGYRASSIVDAFKKTNYFKNKITARVITYKDPEREDEVGYRLK